MQERAIAVPSGQCTVRVDGPDSGHAVLVLPDQDSGPDALTALAERLHTSDLKTVIPLSADALTDADVLAVLDDLALPWVNLVGIGSGADRAWSLAARTFGRIVSLVAVDRPHPAAAQHDPDASFPAVEVRTTVVSTDPSTAAAMSASGRWVYGDFRVAALADDPTAGLATEIVMRTSAW